MKIFDDSGKKHSFGKLYEKSRYKKVLDWNTFLEAEKAITEEKIYRSVNAEKRRTLRKKKILKFNTKIKEKLFSSLITKYIQSYNPDVKLKDLEFAKFIKNRKDNTIVKIQEFKNNEYFELRMIEYDTLYISYFKITTKDIKSKLTVYYSGKSPLPIDILSMKGNMVRIAFNRDFKSYVRRIKEGIKVLENE